jgi:predicted MFS family arabinose efflux permease
MKSSPLSKLLEKISLAPRDLVLFFCVTALAGFSQSIVDSVLNNFLSETFRIGSSQRTILELPRELPGFLVVFISGAFFFLCSRRLASLSNVIEFVGLVLIALFSRSFPVMLGWLFIYSMGQHIFMPLSSAIGMELAEGNRPGRRLGQFQSVGNLFSILGSFAVLIGFSFLHLSFKLSFLIAATGFLIAAGLAVSMKRDTPASFGAKFLLRKEYGLFYALNILFGMRKQIFITFAPWVLVTVFQQKTQVIATLLTAGGIIGIFFKPVLGNLIDRLGERTILAAEAAILVVVCLGYGFARSVFPLWAALPVVFACYVADQMLMAVGMARATYLKKIARSESDVTPTLTMGVTIDHIFSIGVALTAGPIWNRFGYQYVFLFAAVIASINFLVALRVKTPRRPA